MVISTGAGSMPGTDVLEAIATVTGEFPDLVHLPELPQRGPGADMIGRTAALLADVAPDLAVETTPTGWRFADGPGIAMRRAAAYWREDLERFEERCHGVAAPIKVQLAGPITLAAAVGLRRGERAVVDAGAVRDIVHAHRAAACAHVADVRRRLPQAQPIVQLDEPALTAALAGSLPTQSGWGRLAPLEAPQVREWFRETVTELHAAGATVWLHSCAPAWPLELARYARVDGFSGDAGFLRTGDYEDLGRGIEAGMRFVAGVIPTAEADLAAAPRSERATVAPLLEHLHRIGLEAAGLRDALVITPTCGLGNSGVSGARVAMRRTREAAKVVDDVLAERADQ